VKNTNNSDRALSCHDNRGTKNTNRATYIFFLPLFAIKQLSSRFVIR